MIQRMCGTITTPMVVKKGERGADYRSAEETVTTTAPAVRVIDPTGAGDAFAGAYLAHRARGADLASALAAACRMGAAAVQSFGADSLLRLGRIS
jgi:sugar/nucleoside kinase (ribokinase family)